MASIHPYFYVYRAIFLPLASILFVLFALQVFDSRHELKTLKKTGLNVNIVFRVGGLIGAFLMIVGNIDFYGVYGVVPRLIGSLLFSLVCIYFVMLGCIAYSGYATILAVKEFFKGDERMAKRIRYTANLFFIVVWPAVDVLMLLALFIPKLAIVICLYIGLPICFTSLAAAMAYVFSVLNTQYQAIPVKDPTSALAKTVRKFRLFCIVVTTLAVCVSFGFGVTVAGLIRAGNDTVDVRSSVVTDTSQMPGTVGLMEHWVVMFVYYMFLWRSWRKTKVQEKLTSYRSRVGSVADSRPTSPRKSVTAIAVKEQEKEFTNLEDH